MSGNPSLSNIDIFGLVMNRGALDTLLSRCGNMSNDVLTVDGVECKLQKGDMLTIGINVPKPLRFPIKRKATDDATREAVRGHKKFAAAAQHCRMPMWVLPRR